MSLQRASWCIYFGFIEDLASQGGLQAVDSREPIDQEIEVLLESGAHFGMLECLCRKHHGAFTFCFIEDLASQGGVAGGGLAGAN